jgi:hypothetical protein
MRDNLRSGEYGFVADRRNLEQRKINNSFEKISIFT